MQLPLVKFINSCNKMCNDMSLSFCFGNFFLCFYKEEVNLVEKQIFFLNTDLDRHFGRPKKTDEFPKTA